MSVLLSQPKAKKNSLESASVKENRNGKIKKNIMLSFKNSTVHNHPKGMGATGHFLSMTTASEVLDVMLRNGTT